MTTDTPKAGLLKTPEAAEYLNRHPAVLADWRHAGRGPRYIKTGRSVRYRLADLETWIADHVVDPASS